MKKIKNINYQVLMSFECVISEILLFIVFHAKIVNFQGWGAGKFFFCSGSLFYLFSVGSGSSFFSNPLRLLIFFQVAPALAPRDQKHPAPAPAPAPAP